MQTTKVFVGNYVFTKGPEAISSQIKKSSFLPQNNSLLIGFEFETKCIQIIAFLHKLV